MLSQRFTKIVLPALVFGFLLTSATLFHETTTTLREAAGARCSGIWCDDPLPQAGFPFAYLYDDIGTSVIGSLGIEDVFLPNAFLLDWMLFAACSFTPLYLLRRKKV